MSEALFVRTADDKEWHYIGHISFVEFSREGRHEEFACYIELKP